ncbi:unnamed protein product [Chironomus riparius]|uniref:Maelstrom domain-containing protein n=1 Tax=Chironomus riparius TaxID=315576 RepID=A0A9N9RMY5_9DIPT|nr:unnamed protein product [Chironomus riparius]
MNNLKGKTSGFHLYLVEFYGKNNFDEKTTFEKVRGLANSSWNILPKEQRENYRYDSEVIGHDTVDRKVDKIIESFKAIQAKQNQKRTEAARKVKYFLEDTFDLFDWNSHVFLIGHVNYQVKDKNDFYPIEIGLVKYSFDEGLMDTMYIHINSSPLPIGNEKSARERSEDTHQLPFNTNFGVSFNEAKIQISKFLDNEKPFIFTLNEKDDIAAARYTFDKIMDTEVYVVPLENLLLRSYEALYKKDYANDPFDVLMNQNPWEFYDIGCEYHKDLAASKFCSLAKAKRWAYHLSKILLPPELLYPVKHTIC